MDSKVYFFLLIAATTAFPNPLIATNKLSLATWGSYYQQDHMGPGTYAFGYDIEDPVTGNIQFKQEERHPNGTVTGSYGYVDANGRPNVVTYVSDENGYRAKLEIEGLPPQHFPDGSNSAGNSLPRQRHASADEYPVLLQDDLPLHPGGPNYPSYYGYSRPLIF